MRKQFVLMVSWVAGCLVVANVSQIVVPEGGNWAYFLSAVLASLMGMAVLSAVDAPVVISNGGQHQEVSHYHFYKNCDDLDDDGGGDGGGAQQPREPFFPPACRN